MNIEELEKIPGIAKLTYLEVKVFDVDNIYHRSLLIKKAMRTAAALIVHLMTNGVNRVVLTPRDERDISADEFERYVTYLYNVCVDTSRIKRGQHIRAFDLWMSAFDFCAESMFLK